MAMTNTPDKSEKAIERVERRLNSAWAKHGFMTLTVSDLRELLTLARASSRPADQVPDMEERQDGGFFYVEWRGKPCPFCGVAGVSGKSPSGHFFAGCPDADCLAHNLAYDFVTVDHARAAWNARAAIAALQAVPASGGLTKREEHFARLEIRNALGPSSGSIFPEPPALKASGEE